VTTAVPLLPRRLRWLLVILLAGFIFSVSIVTAPPETIVDQGKLDPIPLDKWRHFVAYAVLGYALAYATAERCPERRVDGILIAGVVIAYGLGIEFGQSTLPERFFSPGDATQMLSVAS